MPFGLCNAPSTFQRAMEFVLRGLQWVIVLIYLDDVVITGRTFEEHLNNLDTVLDRFQENCLKLKASKCKLFQTRVPFLGHVVSGNGVETNPELTKDVNNWPTPNNEKELHSFLGLSNYYRRFVDGYAEKATPLYDMLKKALNLSGGESQDTSFLALKEALVKAPVLTFPNETDMFLLDTDASNHTIGDTFPNPGW